MKKTIPMILALLLCMGVLFSCAYAEDAQISIEVDWSEAVQVESSGPDNPQLAEQYVYSISKKPARGIGFMAKRAASMSFDGTQSRIYALLKADVALVAAGTRSSTQFIYDAADAYEQTAFTPEDLGLGKFIENGAFTDEATAAIGAKVAPDLNVVLDMLMRDCPYEMYWFDKTYGVSISYPGTFSISADGNTISFRGQLVLTMRVAEEFQLNQQIYECDPAFGTTAQAVSTRAQGIVAEHAALDDAAKLQAYKEDICDLTSYNFDAPGTVSYGNPWQLLWVFDDDPDTEVVCEGYAKAFQYLCNLSTFQNASVITASGTMEGGTGAGDHMWNIARLPDGWNYLVDVTNCDDNSIGWPNELMLAAADSGSVANGYVFTANDEPVFYAYDAETRSLYSADELAVRCIVASGTCGAQGDNLTWTLDSDGTLTISGSGEMADYEDTIGNNGFVTSAPWGEYAASINSVVVSSGVTSIGNSAFSGCGSLTNITIPESVNSIGLCSFEYCSGLTTITIPDDVTSIGSFAFSGCTSLTSIAIPEGVTSIGESAFYGCSNLTGSITIPDGVTSIGSSTFSGCTSLTSIAIPEGVTSIGEYAFQGCSNLTGSITIPDGVTIIGSSTFSGCSNLTSITIPDSVTNIGVSAFWGCSKLTSIAIPDSLTIIDNYAFSGCSSLTSIAIPEGVTSIGISAFCGCSNLTGSITIPNGVTSIGAETFSGCSNLTGITIPEGVISIGYYAFYHCSSLESMTIPDSSVTIIGEGAFCGCSSLSEFTIPDGVTNIGDFAFSDCSNLTGGITIPDGVTSIGYAAFSGCASLTSVTILDGVTSIGNSAFYGCSGLTGIAIPDSVTSIGDYAFSYCTGLTSITIPEGVTSIGDYAFFECTGMTSITIPEGVTSIGDSAFAYCSDLTSITIPNSVTSIGVSAFSDCENLTSITIPDGLTNIGDYAFSYCYALDKICILGETTSFGNAVFEGYPAPTIYCWEYSDVEGWAIDNGYTVVLLDTLTDSQREMTLPADFRLHLGESRKLDILLFPDDNPEITWVSSDPAVVSVQDGVVTGLSCGTAAITASVGTISGNVVITVFIPAESFELNKQEVWLIAKESLQLSVENILPDGAGAEVSWSSSDTTLATVDVNGFVTTKKPGDVTITATTENGISASCVLHLTRAVTSVTLSPASATLYPDDTAQLVSTAVTSTDTYTNKLVVYTSSDETVATVDDDGLVLALRPGTAIITAATSNEKYAYATINVLCPSHVSVTDPAVASTCTETGLTAGEHCSVCGEVLIAQEIVPALGHDWGAVTYTWSADDRTVTAARACAREGCDEAETETAQYTFALAKAPTDTEMGETIYTATFENTAFDVEKTVADIPALQDMALLKLPAGLSAIEDEAFMGLACEGILIPDGCTSIGLKAFANCTRLVYVKIPAGIGNIAGDAFEGCPLVRIDAAE